MTEYRRHWIYKLEVAGNFDNGVMQAKTRWEKADQWMRGKKVEMTFKDNSHKAGYEKPQEIQAENNNDNNEKSSHWWSTHYQQANCS